jgi:hypothetical protein
LANPWQIAMAPSLGGSINQRSALPHDCKNYADPVYAPNTDPFIHLSR